MPPERQGRPSTYVYACQLTYLRLSLNWLNPMPSGLAWVPGIHGTIEPVWRSRANDVSAMESIPSQQPSMRGIPANREP